MTDESLPSGATYADSGVSIEDGERAVELMREWVEKARRPEVVGGIGGFAGLFDASALKNFERPLLAASADGVGTKVAVAQRMDVHDTIGFDLVGMLVDDLVVSGAEPLFVTDYIACGSVVPERIASIVKGIAAACNEVGCALLGGETAEHPGLLSPEEYDVAGSTTGVVEAEKILGAHLVRPGDVVIAMASSGMHSNGFSLARHVFFEQAGWDVDRHVDELGHTLGEELLVPTRLYARACLDIAGLAGVHAMSHITGGGLASNVARILPESMSVRIDRSTWSPPPVFHLLGQVGGVVRDDLEHAVNMGVGMTAVCAADAAEGVLAALAGHGFDAWVCGSVASGGDGDVSLVADYR